MKDHITEALAAALVDLNSSDYKTSWRLVPSNVSFDYRESEDLVELEWDDLNRVWRWESSGDEPITTEELVKFMQPGWVDDVHITIIAYDNNHHSNVLSVEIENGKVVAVG